MENNVNDTHKVYSERMISSATFIGTPVAGFHLIAKNYTAFGDKKSARNSYIFGVVLTAFIFTLIFLLPEATLDKIPNYLFPAIYTGLVYWAAMSLQNEKIKNFLSEGGQKASPWSVAGISVLYLIILVILLVPISIMMPLYDGEVMKFGQVENEIYYDAEIPESDITKIGQALYDLEFFDDEYQAAIQVRLENQSKYRVILPTYKEMWDDEEFLTMMGSLSEVFQEYVPSKDFGITLLHETLTRDEMKKLN